MCGAFGALHPDAITSALTTEQLYWFAEHFNKRQFGWHTLHRQMARLISLVDKAAGFEGADKRTIEDYLPWEREGTPVRQELQRRPAGAPPLPSAAERDFRSRFKGIPVAPGEFSRERSNGA